jgi:hypothetical protein
MCILMGLVLYATDVVLEFLPTQHSKTLGFTFSPALVITAVRAQANHSSRLHLKMMVCTYTCCALSVHILVLFHDNKTDILVMLLMNYLYCTTAQL